MVSGGWIAQFWDIGKYKMEDWAFQWSAQNLWIWLTNGFQTRMFFARAWLVLMVMTCVKNWVTFPKMCAFWMEHPCTQKTAKYGSNYRKSTSDRVQKMCGNCLICEQYAKSALDNRQSLDSTKREERRNPSSNYPIQYLSPQSKSLRLSNSR